MSLSQSCDLVPVELESVTGPSDDQFPYCEMGKVKTSSLVLV